MRGLAFYKLEPLFGGAFLKGLVYFRELEIAVMGEQFLHS